MDNIVIFTGGFDPIHSGHISCIKEARKLGRVVIGLNSDEWLARKKGKPFLTFEERKAVLDEFKDILCVIAFDDSDDTASDAIRQVMNLFPKNKIIFVNGGDRTEGNIPELEVFRDHPRVSFQFGIGGQNKKIVPVLYCMIGINQLKKEFGAIQRPITTLKSRKSKDW
jgi:D-beta-D-heptose 7-phosphate kinase/D-beta-D-heptose 1-phosphate adenosyltransferase